MEYRIFVMNLANLDRYKKDQQLLKSQTEDLLYAMGGVKGLSYDQVMVHGNPSVTEEKRLEMIDKYNIKLKQLEFVNHAISEVETTLMRMPVELSTMLKRIYVDGWTFRKLGEEYGYSDHGLWQMLKRETERYL